MGRQDDSDMKIVSGAFAPETEAGESPAALADAVARAKENGDLARARNLGALLAERVLPPGEAPAVGETSPDGTPTDSETPLPGRAAERQGRFLKAFAVEAALDAYLPNTVLADTAKNVFYEALTAAAPGFTEELQESGAFSFYYLCVRGGVGAERKIGESYAMLCGRAEDAGFAKIGEKRYLTFLDEVKAMIDADQFES